jgi:hypothetical protein
MLSIIYVLRAVHDPRSDPQDRIRQNDDEELRSIARASARARAIDVPYARIFLCT